MARAHGKANIPKLSGDYDVPRHVPKTPRCILGRATSASDGDVKPLGHRLRALVLSRMA